MFELLPFSRLPFQTLPFSGLPFASRASYALDLKFDTDSFDRSLLTSATTTLGTEFDTAGLLRYAPHNMFTYSEQFDNAVFTKTRSSISANAAVAPDGTTTADKLLETADSGTHKASHAFTTIAGLVYTGSIYMKAAERTWGCLNATGVSGSQVTFDLENGVVGTIGWGANSASIEDVGNGWYRCSMTFTASTTANNIEPLTATGTSTFSYAGDVTKGIYIWGAQLEQNPSARTYHATTSAAWYGPRKHVVYDGDQYPDMNLLLQSNGFDTTWTNTNSIDASGQGISPDGSNNAWKITDDSAGGTGSVFITQSVTITDAAHIYSLFCKADGLSWVALATSSFTTNGTSYFDLANGVVGTTSNTSSGIEDVGNGWYRCWAVFTPGADTAGVVRVFLADGNLDASVDRDGTSSILIYGAQLENAETGQTTPGTYHATATVAYYGGQWPEMNLLLQSQTFDNASWTKGNSTVSANAVAAPDGTMTADRMIDNEAGGTGSCNLLQAATPGFGARFTFSVYAKADQLSWLNFSLGAFPSAISGTNSRAYFNIGAGIVGTTASGVDNASIEDVGNGWYRCSATYTTTAADGTGNFIIYLSDGDGDVTVALDGTSSIFLWGAQVEKVNTGQITPGTYHVTTSTTYTGVLSNGPWLDKGLLVEGAATNMLTYSEQLDNAAWTKTNATAGANASVSPDGKATMDSFTGDAGTAGKSLRTAVTIVNGTDYVYSFFVKKQSSFIQVYSNSGWAGNSKVNIDLLTGVVSADFSFTASAEDFGTFWRVSVEGPATATSSNIYISLITDITAARGASTAVVGPIYLWGMQFELGTFPTSYIPTVASSVARGVDLISIATSSISGFSATEGTIVVAATAPSAPAIADGNRYVYTLGDGTNNEVVKSYVNVASAITTKVKDGGAVQATLGGDAVTPDADFTYAVAWKINDFASSFNGAAAVIDLAGTIGTTPTLYMGAGESGALDLWSSSIQSLTYYPTRLSDITLQALTA